MKNIFKKKINNFIHNTFYKIKNKKIYFLLPNKNRYKNIYKQLIIIKNIFKKKYLYKDVIFIQKITINKNKLLKTMLNDYNFSLICNYFNINLKKINILKK